MLAFFAGSIYQGSERFKGQTMLFYEFFSVTMCSFTSSLWHSQTNDRILEEGDRMYMNALDNQVIPYSEMILLNYLPDDVPLDSKFIP